MSPEQAVDRLNPASGPVVPDLKTLSGVEYPPHLTETVAREWPEFALSKRLGVDDIVPVLHRMLKDPTHSNVIRRTPEWREWVAQNPTVAQFDAVQGARPDTVMVHNSLAPDWQGLASMMPMAVPGYDAAATASRFTGGPELPQLKLPIPKGVPFIGGRQLSLSDLMLGQAGAQSLADTGLSKGLIRNFGQRLIGLNPGAATMGGKLMGIPRSVGGLWRFATHLNALNAAYDPLHHTYEAWRTGSDLPDAARAGLERATQLGQIALNDQPVGLDEVMRGDRNTSPFWNVGRWARRMLSGQAAQVAFHEAPALAQAAHQAVNDTSNNLQAATAPPITPSIAYKLFRLPPTEPITPELMPYRKLIERIRRDNPAIPQQVRSLTLPDFEEFGRQGGRQSLMATDSGFHEPTANTVVRTLTPQSVNQPAPPGFGARFGSLPDDYKRHIRGLYGLPGQ